MKKLLSLILIISILITVLSACADKIVPSEASAPQEEFHKSVEEKNAKVKDIFDSVIKGDIKVYRLGESPTVLAMCDTYSGYVYEHESITAYIDCDGDGINEIVVQSGLGGDHLLHYDFDDGRVYAYFFSPRDGYIWFADGTYWNNDEYDTERYRITAFNNTSLESDTVIYENGGACTDEPEWSSVSITAPIDEFREHRIIYLGKGFKAYSEITDALKRSPYYDTVKDIPQSRYISASEGTHSFIILPAATCTDVRVNALVKADTASASEELYSTSDTRPFIVKCNNSDTVSDTVITLTANGKEYSFSPTVSPNDGKVIIEYPFGEYDREFSFRDITRYKDEENEEIRKIFTKVLMGEVLIYPDGRKPTALALCNTYYNTVGEQLLKQLAYIDCDKDGIFEALISTEGGDWLLHYDFSDGRVYGYFFTPRGGCMWFANGEYWHNDTTKYRYRITEFQKTGKRTEKIEYPNNDAPTDAPVWVDIEITSIDEDYGLYSEITDDRITVTDNVKIFNTGYISLTLPKDFVSLAVNGEDSASYKFRHPTLGSKCEFKLSISSAETINKLTEEEYKDYLDDIIYDDIKISSFTEEEFKGYQCTKIVYDYYTADRQFTSVDYRYLVIGLGEYRFDYTYPTNQAEELEPILRSITDSIQFKD